MFAYAHPSPFPPSFEGNPWAYCFGLFGDVIAASLALTMLIAVALENRRGREVSGLLNNPVELPGIPRWSPLFLYRTGWSSMLLFVVMRTLPDAIWMLAWGEVGEQAIRVLLSIDLWADGLALAPLSLSVVCWAWGRQVIPQQLLNEEGSRPVRRPPWSTIWKNGRIVLVVLVIAIGVTIGKASA
jgi:hypothetical protein